MRSHRSAKSAFAIASLLVTGFALTACATEPITTSQNTTAESQPPTLARDQSVDDACKLSSEHIDQLVLLTEDQIGVGIEQAKTDALNGEWPSLDFLQFDAAESFGTVRETVVNPEVSAAIDRVFVQFTGFTEIEQPETPLGVLPYLASLGTQIDQLRKAGTDLAQLCAPPVPAAEIQ